MLNYWAKENKITDKALQVQVSANYLYTSGGYVYYDCRRIATKTYSYIGMTEAAAHACQKAKLKQYTRKFNLYSGNGSYQFNPAISLVPVANVSLRYDGGGLWSVDIDVNEEQRVTWRCTQAESKDPPIDELFDVTQDYDEDPPEGACLRIAAVYMKSDSLYLQYDQAIAEFSRASNSFHVEKSTDGTTWSELTPTQSSKDGLLCLGSGTWTGNSFRLRWGSDVISNIVALGSTVPSYTGSLSLGEPYYMLGAWRVDYTQSFPDFDRLALRVQSRASTSEAWQDIADQCSVLGDFIVTPYTEEATSRYLRIVYGETVSAAVRIVYDYNPEHDHGDGSMAVQGASCADDNAVSVWAIFIAYPDSVDPDLFTVKESQDGVTWTDGELLREYTVNSPEYKFIKLALSLTGPRYLRVYYNGVQVSDGFSLPYKAESDGFWHRGLSRNATTFWFRYHSSSSFGIFGGDLDVDDLGMQVSTDGGETWSVVAGSANSSWFELASPLEDLTPRLFRFTYQGNPIAATERPNLKYPLA